MTWFAPVLVTAEGRFRSSAPDVWASSLDVGSLGSAIAGPWSWDERASAPTEVGAHAAPRQPAGVRLNAPARTLRRMAEAASVLGRSESDVWVEAAREWLLRHHPEDAHGGHTPYGAPAPVAHALTRRLREWRAIDDLLDTLRNDRSEARRELIPA
ncbi:MAG TPA: hypothetical protein VFQ25_08525 [Ktedonobacterales bacterium]|nr:hypothetical protein [Ktedonobacterales bacterium]